MWYPLFIWHEHQEEHILRWHLVSLWYLLFVEKEAKCCVNTFFSFPFCSWLYWVGLLLCKECINWRRSLRNWGNEGTKNNEVFYCYSFVFLIYKKNSKLKKLGIVLHITTYYQRLDFVYFKEKQVKHISVLPDLFGKKVLIFVCLFVLLTVVFLFQL